MANNNSRDDVLQGGYCYLLSICLNNICDQNVSQLCPCSAVRGSFRPFLCNVTHRKVLIYNIFKTRALGFEPRCRGFESLRAHHNPIKRTGRVTSCFIGAVSKCFAIITHLLYVFSTSSIGFACHDPPSKKI